MVIENGCSNCPLAGLGCAGECDCNCGCNEGLEGLGATWWQDLIKTGVDTTSGILTSRYGVPPAGTSVIQQNADGSNYQVLRAPNYPGVGVSAFPAFGSGINTNQILIFGGLGLAALLAFKAIAR